MGLVKEQVLMTDTLNKLFPEAQIIFEDLPSETAVKIKYLFLI